MIYLTSDTHFSHSNIIKYSNRPFSCAQEMDDTLINNWNAKISPKDTVYHLGDFGFNYKNIGSILSRLNFGHLHVLKGNHEKPFAEYFRRERPNRVSFYSSYMELKSEGDLFVLSHYPILEWNKCHHGAYHCYGHVHNKHLSEIALYRSIDVGVDAQDYSPISIPEIIEKLKDRKIKTHHEASADLQSTKRMNFLKRLMNLRDLSFRNGLNNYECTTKGSGEALGNGTTGRKGKGRQSPQSPLS